MAPFAANANTAKVQARTEIPVWPDMSIPLFLYRRGAAHDGQAISTHLELLLFYQFGTVLSLNLVYEDTSVPVGLTDMVLGIELEAELRDKIELSLQEVDVFLFVVHQFLEQIARHVVLD